MIRHAPGDDSLAGAIQMCLCPQAHRPEHRRIVALALLTTTPLLLYVFHTACVKTAGVAHRHGRTCRGQPSGPRKKKSRRAASHGFGWMPNIANAPIHALASVADSPRSLLYHTTTGTSKLLLVQVNCVVLRIAPLPFCTAQTRGSAPHRKLLLRLGKACRRRTPPCRARKQTPPERRKPRCPKKKG